MSPEQRLFLFCQNRFEIFWEYFYSPVYCHLKSRVVLMTLPGILFKGFVAGHQHLQRAAFFSANESLSLGSLGRKPIFVEVGVTSCHC